MNKRIKKKKYDIKRNVLCYSPLMNPERFNQPAWKRKRARIRSATIKTVHADIRYIMNAFQVQNKNHRVYTEEGLSDMMRKTRENTSCFVQFTPDPYYLGMEHPINLKEVK